MYQSSENCQPDSKSYLTNYQTVTDDSGYSADSFTNSITLNGNQFKSTNLDDEKTNENYFLTTTNNQLNQSFEHLNQNSMEKERNSMKDNQTNQNSIKNNCLDQMNRSVLENKILNEHPMKNQMKFNYIESLCTKDNLNCNLDPNLDSNLDCNLDQTKMDETTERLDENVDEILNETNNELKIAFHQNPNSDDNYQLMYNSTPFLQSNLETMDIYYPSTELISVDYSLNMKDSTRHLDNFNQSLDKQFYTTITKSNQETEINRNDEQIFNSFHTDNLNGPGVNSNFCDDYVVTFLN